MMHFFSKLKSRYIIVTSDFKTVEKKFLDQGIGKPLVKDYLAKFKSLREKNKLSGDEKNIDLWGKKTFEDFKSFVDKLSKVKTKTEVKKEARVEGAKLIAENEGWKVYEITSHKAAMLYGANTKWCITEKKPTHYQDYSEKNNIYYLISKKNLNPRARPLAKIALLVDREGKKTYWDVQDFSHESVPQDLKIPTFKTKVPTHIVIEGNRYDDFNKLPKNLKIKGDLDLSQTNIKSLPDGLKVGGKLDLKNTPITSLPPGLEVGGNLDLSQTNIKSLPDGLKVGGYLDLFGTTIKSLPDGLKVGSLSIRGTPITSLPENLKVEGDLDLSHTKITSLPAGLEIGGNLDLRGTKITSLPEGLKVGGNLLLEDTKITSLPDDLIVRKIYVDDPPKIQCSDELRKKLRT